MFYVIFSLHISSIVLKQFFFNPHLLMGIIDPRRLPSILSCICDSCVSSLIIYLIWGSKSITRWISWHGTLSQTLWKSWLKAQSCKVPHDFHNAKSALSSLSRSLERFGYVLHQRYFCYILIFLIYQFCVRDIFLRLGPNICLENFGASYKIRVMDSDRLITPVMINISNNEIKIKLPWPLLS